MNATSPKSSLAKLGLYPRPKTLKVMILGQSGVGKSAMVVRFITRRYIGEYDPTLEKIYTFHTLIDNEMVYFEILDTAGQPHAGLNGKSIVAEHAWTGHHRMQWKYTNVSDKEEYWFEQKFTFKPTRMFHLSCFTFLVSLMCPKHVNFPIDGTVNFPWRWLIAHCTLETECLGLEANIRWAEAFILMYSVTDKCSFDECHRLKFLINYNKRRRRLGSAGKDSCGDVPVVLVGNKIDQVEDRMITTEEGQKRSKEIGCVCFHEISVRESIDQVWNVFRDVCRFWRVHSKNPTKLRRSGSEKEPISPDTVRLLCSAAVSPSSLIPYSCRPACTLGRRWTEEELEEEDETGSKESNASSTSPVEHPPFRERASTDGHIHQKPWRWRYPPPSSKSDPSYHSTAGADRRMSISMKGSNASY